MTLKTQQHTSLWQDLCRDFHTLQRLRGKQKLIFLWDYYKWKILVTICTIFTIITFICILWEGQKPCRLRVCVVLNTEEDSQPWFSSFTEKLQSDGKPGAVDINFDQPFNINNPYHNIHEIEVMSTISSERMDVAVCREDLYRYLLSLNACFPLDQCLSKDLYQTLSEEGKLVYDTAGLTADKDGSIKAEGGIDGYYAVDCSGSQFFTLYCASTNDEPLYAVIISNTSHLEECNALIRALTEE